ncbi:MAG: 2-hydroxychromene-2-carboxylate isomerase [Rhodospirillales bacterium]|nr:2-hydroxychromene-2-carboxylate isomerase [Rhodospirillales bacterium]
MALSIDLFWSFRSPYCYLALDRLLALNRDFGVEINVRPIYPIAVRTPNFFKNTNPLYRPYHTRDSHRVAEHLGIPFRRPVPDPIPMDMETGIPDAEQPYIYRLVRLGQAAVMAGKGLEFLDHVSRILWDGSVDGWYDPPHLAGAMMKAGLDPERLEANVATEPDKFDAEIEKNQIAHTAAGHWGVPLMVFDGEPFYGQDRVEMLIWRMRQKGL